MQCECCGGSDNNNSTQGGMNIPGKAVPNKSKKTPDKPKEIDKLKGLLKIKDKK